MHNSIPSVKDTLLNVLYFKSLTLVTILRLFSEICCILSDFLHSISEAIIIVIKNGSSDDINPIQLFCVASKQCVLEVAPYFCRRKEEGKDCTGYTSILHIFFTLAYSALISFYRTNTRLRQGIIGGLLFQVHPGT